MPFLRGFVNDLGEALAGLEKLTLTWDEGVDSQNSDWL